MRILTERVDGLLVEARQLGVDLEEVVQLVRQRAGGIEWESKSESRGGVKN